MSTYCPDGVGRWFYERAAGSYNTLLAREGSTPARYRHLKTVVTPPSRKLMKTDLAKYLNAWECKPEVVSLGAQKNFGRFMEDLRENEEHGSLATPDAREFKRMVAKAILFKKAQSLVRPMFPAFQGNVTIYLIALLADRLGDRLDLEKIWSQQDISARLKDQLKAWAQEVNTILHRSADGKMISEWSKKPECWAQVRRAKYSPLLDGVPEVRPI